MSWSSGWEHRIQSLLFLISRVWVWIPQSLTFVSLSKTLYHCFVLRVGRKAVGPMCCVTHVKDPSALAQKGRGSPRCSWLWLLYAPEHLLNPCKVLHNWVSEFITSITYLSESVYILSALSTLLVCALYKTSILLLTVTQEGLGKYQCSRGWSTQHSRTED